MYVDFKEEATMQPGFGNGLLWMMSGIMMGLLVGLAMYYFANRGVPSVTSANASPSTQTTPAKSTDLAKVGSAFGEDKDANDPADLMVASLVDKNNNKEEAIERPNFSYYAVLPDLNVPVQTIQNPPAKKAQKEPKKDKPINDVVATSGSSDFILQVASYRKRGQADRTRGRLKRKGMPSYVQERRIKGKTWFRVMAGPVDSKKLNNWKATVASLGHKPLIIPIK